MPAGAALLFLKRQKFKVMGYKDRRLEKSTGVRSETALGSSVKELVFAFGKEILHTECQHAHTSE